MREQVATSANRPGGPGPARGGGVAWAAVVRTLALSPVRWETSEGFEPQGRHDHSDPGNRESRW